MLEEKVYNGFDNPIELELYVNNSLLTHTTITRAQIEIGNTVIDSSDHPAWFDFSNPDRLILRLGDAGLAPAGQVARLIVFDAIYTGGAVWGEIMLLVFD